MLVSVYNEGSFSVTAVRNTAIQDDSRVNQLQSENDQLQEQINELQSENSSLTGELNRARSFQSAVEVDISTSTQNNQNRELSQTSQEFATTNNINFANESANFSAQNVVAQTGSILAAQANSSTTAVQRLTS